MKYIFPVVFLLSLAACNLKPKELPYLGYTEVGQNGDSIYHKIPNFVFLDENSDTVTQDLVKNKIYVADFFFSTCPTICPIMKTQMLRIFEQYKDEEGWMILSHSINPRYDTPEVLKAYKEKLQVNSPKWQFLTGTLTNVYDLAQTSYFLTAREDSSAVSDGGFDHSGNFVLVDKDRHVRGIYDGTKAKEVDRLMVDMRVLLDAK